MLVDPGGKGWEDSMKDDECQHGKTPFLSDGSERQENTDFLGSIHLTSGNSIAFRAPFSLGLSEVVLMVLLCTYPARVFTWALLDILLRSWVHRV